ncbi:MULTISPECIES: YhcH/YjgK/YiaL family protein [Lactiplantibacillus]|uniref:DUF386 domain-containing protein n=1 Tax=Lactiplantibacillus pentosus TaxID=1589 RepID=A0ABD7IP54_LACPE|nr:MULTISPECIES: YhcH/YjgK/YiaL family protein [Lactiplantibacillus]MCC3163908.1 YhcH/YjgK/YiaL family protein [Lactiplantibacillus pentosus]MCJ8188907.1 YhcH/YjgK/YiaL family protein [Lactiplantibacillus pentosus]MCM8608886.1 YhcH/YjgK/YiaL family protein [Lactiplantibacillus sp. B652]PRO93896.1 hypothetical protein C6Y08_11240 [Lactiplantibacillus pentosus]RMW46477.1 DUF386 domain-containing protein [Lactiplantibacillus pentosus]
MIIASIDSKTATWLENRTEFNPVLEFLKTTDLTQLDVGHHKITSNISANVQEYLTKAENEGRWESHVNNIDFQYIQHGSEYIRVCSASQLKVKTDALSQKDAYYYQKYQGSTTNVLVNPGDFVILFPEDAHEACINVEKASSVRKLVIKVPVALFK